MSDESIVFVVDDDEAVLASMEALLKSFGHLVETYNSAEAFLAGYDGDRRGCLVLDVRLQGMSGPELQAALTAKGIVIPIVMISGHMDRESARSASSNGTVACLEKPFSGEDLCEAVRMAQSQNEGPHRL